MEPYTNILKPFNTNILFGILLSSKSALFVNINDLENKKIEPNKEDK